MSVENNPKLYRRMSEPFGSPSDGRKAIEAFFEELQALREKHHIRDVSVVWTVACVDGNDETEMVGRAHLGSTAKELPMLAWALGRAEEAMAADLSRIRKGR